MTAPPTSQPPTSQRTATPPTSQRTATPPTSQRTTTPPTSPQAHLTAPHPARPQETTEAHSRLLKCALEVEDSRAYWARADGAHQGALGAVAARAFDEYWFGARSLARVTVLLTNLRARFDAFPNALAALHSWPHMTPDTRRLICHWHLQLTDPLYRRFTGHSLAARYQTPKPEITRDYVVRWVCEEGPAHWTLATRVQCASKLLSAAYSAGLVSTNKGLRQLTLPRVPNEALEYLMYLLREVKLEGNLLMNPYLSSLALEEGTLEQRLRALPGLAFSRQGSLVDFGWRYPSLSAWASATLSPSEQLAEVAT